MGAGADRIGQLGQIEFEPFGKGGGERLQIRGPGPVVMAPRLAMEREQPAPAVRPLEAAGISAVEIGELARNVAGRQHLLRQRLDLPRLGQLGKQPSHAQHQPPAMDAAVPVEAAEEDRVQVAGAEHVLRPFHHMIELMRIFASDVAERDRSEAAGNFGGELVGHRNPRK